MKITKQTVFVVIILGLIFLVVGLFSIYFSVLAAFAENDILKSLIDVNAALIGFLGIIAIFVLTEYRSSMHRIDDNIEREKQDKRAREKLQKDLSELRSNQKGSILIIVATVMSFLGSTIASLVAMSIKDIPSRAFPIYICMVLMLGGVVFMFLLVIGFAFYSK